jgi:hypothetical protein
MLHIDESRFFDIFLQVASEHSMEDDEAEAICEEILTKLADADDTPIEEDTE